jgi:hypothetical protein
MSFAAADIADWFEAKRLTRQHDLEEWVQDNPQWWNVGLATIGATSMEFVGTYVDLLRLGEGVAEGGWRGVGTDALRLISIVPVGRLAKYAAVARRTRQFPKSLKLASQVKGVSGPCTFQAANNAMQISRGKSLFLTVGEMAAARGKKIADLTTKAGKVGLAAWVDDLVGCIRANGGRVKLVKGLNTVEDVVNIAKAERAPVIFAFGTKVKTAEGATKTIRHSVIAMRDASGAVKFADYGGKVFSTLEELVQRWGTRTQPIQLISKFEGASAAVVGGTAEALGEFGRLLQQGAVLVLNRTHVVETEKDGVDVAFPVTVVAVNASSPSDASSGQVVKESFENFLQNKSGGPLAATKPERAPDMKAPAENHARPTAAPRADWLTGVQFRLNHLGFGAGPVDGIDGPRTQRAVRRFQQSHPPLKVDGIPGPRTQAELTRVCGY